MNNEDLKKLKQDWYSEASSNGTIAMLWKIAKELGTSLNAKCPPKWQWTQGNIKIYADGYGNYLTVHVAGKEVVSTHETERLFVPGDWLKEIQPFVSEAESHALEQRRIRYQSERQKLLEELGLI